ncbi:hypothetical protein AVEN_55930-1 [Araneus ventricosus]|uniref:Uncharacterized protein n=1 Tax=Araneus ventricosus TaxID=182803 RepID=A0A4Y2W672_ARAVE|nr:hypothetical protein AVEN_55930-1 [Araneus ventricosus]
MRKCSEAARGLGKLGNSPCRRCPQVAPKREHEENNGSIDMRAPENWQIISLSYWALHAIKTAALRSFLSLPITVAAEVSVICLCVFMKHIQTFLRSTMSQERLVDFAVMPIGRDFLQNIETEDIMKDFADKNARKVSF